MENPFKDVKFGENKEEISDTESEINDKVSLEESTETENEKEVIEETQNEDAKNEWQDKYEKLNDQYIRLAADFDNFRKRQAQERESLLKYGAETTVMKLLEVIDNFERGLKAIETVEDCEKVKECYNLAYKNFNDVLSKIGVEVIKAEGEEFDPNLHEAVMRTPTEEKPENTIISELQKGYKLGDKVLRPTLVNVASAD
ncbi:MAG: nucleotide exchange factor GrpE [bacterium]|nr:nucleotide exchange factor GrpE [bacterium]